MGDPRNIPGRSQIVTPIGWGEPGSWKVNDKLDAITNVVGITLLSEPTCLANISMNREFLTAARAQTRPTRALHIADLLNRVGITDPDTTLIVLNSHSYLDYSVTPPKDRQCFFRTVIDCLQFPYIFINNSTMRPENLIVPRKKAALHKAMITTAIINPPPNPTNHLTWAILVAVWGLSLLTGQPWPTLETGGPNG